MATVWHDEPTGLLAVRFAYNPTIVDRIKSEIPRGSRRWNPERKLWLVDPPYETTVRRILGLPPRAEHQQQQARKPTGIDLAVDGFFAELPDHLREAAYKALIKIAHPDVGGDTRIAQALNRWRQERAS